ncbi:DUF4192 domain-containing protein [Spirillospora sp. NPDC047279]|uniref:DUF4192 domain-containing protein n=1 Tax=Spirillospora sp. NPDC047279 TaxID=3155478 RepID=UPI0033EBE17A
MKTRLVIRSPQDAIAAVPYLLGFHPSESLVVIGYDGPHDTCAMRLDLPQPDAAGRVATMLRHNGFRRALLLCYGTAQAVTPTVQATWEALTEGGLEVADAIRVTGDRWWSLTDECCPDGHPYDSSSTVVAAEATLAGQVALHDRAELARTIAPLEGLPRASVRRATDHAETRFLSWAREGLAPAQIQARLLHRAVPLLGLSGTAAALSDDDIAWLGIALTNMRVRDEAWLRIDKDDPSSDIAFWRDVLRRVEEPYAAAPACLLAIAAYASGDGGLANLALDRAEDSDPAYSLASLLRAVIAVGIPPSELRLSLTPEALATAYTDPEPAYTTRAYTDPAYTDPAAPPHQREEPDLTNDPRPDP